MQYLRLNSNNFDLVFLVTNNTVFVYLLSFKIKAEDIKGTFKTHRSCRDCKHIGKKINRQITFHKTQDTKT